MSTAEVDITIRLDADADVSQLGIVADAEVLFDECFYSKSVDIPNALAAVIDALRNAIRICEDRAER